MQQVQRVQEGKQLTKLGQSKGLTSSNNNWMGIDRSDNPDIETHDLSKLDYKIVHVVYVV